MDGHQPGETVLEIHQHGVRRKPVLWCYVRCRHGVGMSVFSVCNHAHLSFVRGGPRFGGGLSDELRPFVDVECQLVELFMPAKIQIKNNNTKQQ